MRKPRLEKAQTRRPDCRGATKGAPLGMNSTVRQANKPPIQSEVAITAASVAEVDLIFGEVEDTGVATTATWPADVVVAPGVELLPDDDANRLDEPPLDDEEPVEEEPAEEARPAAAVVPPAMARLTSGFVPDSLRK